MDIALKVIPKKKVKGNEEAVWGEMEVLRGLDHPNIVSSCIPWSTWVFRPTADPPGLSTR